jgi:chromosome segregation ATPase
MMIEIRYDEPPHDTCEALAWFRARVKELEAELDGAEREFDRQRERAKRAERRNEDLEGRLAALAETHQRTLDRLHETERRLAALLEIQGQGGHTSERDGGIGEVER